MYFMTPSPILFFYIIDRLNIYRPSLDYIPSYNPMNYVKNKYNVKIM